MQEFTNLGTVVVFDAKKLVIGSHIVIDKIPFLVEKIIDEKVFLQPILGWNLLVYYYFKHFRKWVLLLLGSGLSLAILIWILVHLKL